MTLSKYFISDTIILFNSPSLVKEPFHSLDKYKYLQTLYGFHLSAKFLLWFTQATTFSTKSFNILIMISLKSLSNSFSIWVSFLLIPQQWASFPLSSLCPITFDWMLGMVYRIAETEIIIIYSWNTACLFCQAISVERLSQFRQELSLVQIILLF